MPSRSFVLALMIALAPAMAAAQTQRLSDDQIREIEYHYKLDQYMVAGCIFGAAVGATTGLLRLSGISMAVAPYISTGCSLGFLIAPTGMMIRDFINELSPRHAGSAK
jgi:hypothetical protein